MRTHWLFYLYFYALQVFFSGASSIENLVASGDRMHGVGFCIKPFEGGVGKRYFYFLTTSFRQADTAELSERLDRTLRVVRTAQIDLHHFFPVAFADVLYGNRQHGRFTVLQSGFVQACRLISILCIAQSVAEGEQRGSVEIAVSTSFHGIILKIGQLFRALVKCDRKASGWIVITEEYAGYKTSAAALPPDCPGYHACRMASQFSASGAKAMAEPE